jgi:hypothetical protein
MGSEAKDLAALSCCPRTSAADGHRGDPDRRLEDDDLLARSVPTRLPGVARADRRIGRALGLRSGSHHDGVE